MLLYVVVIAVWPLLIGSLAAGVSYGVTSSLGLVGELPWLRAKMLRVFSIGMLALFFSWLYYAVPNAAVRWRDAWIAGLASALGFVLLQNAFEWYLAVSFLQGDLWRICGGADLPALGLSVLGSGAAGCPDRAFPAWNSSMAEEAAPPAWKRLGSAHIYTVDCAVSALVRMLAGHKAP